MDNKKYTVNDIIYREIYRNKLTFSYYLFSKNAIFLTILTY